MIGDSIGPDGSAASSDCVAAGHPASECARVTTPSFGSFPNTDGVMHTAGTVEQISNVPGTTGCESGVAVPAPPAPPPSRENCDTQHQWGAGIAVDFNDPNGTPLPYDALTAGACTLSGFAYDFAGTELPPSEYLIGGSISPPAYGVAGLGMVAVPGNAADVGLVYPNLQIPLGTAGHHQIFFGGFQRGLGPDPLPTSVPLASGVVSISFLVVASPYAAEPYDFQISRLAMIVE